MKPHSYRNGKTEYFILTLIILASGLVYAANHFTSFAFTHNTDERVNVAAATNGGIATASSSKDENKFPAASVIDGDRKGLNWSEGGGWADGTPGEFPDTIEVQFNDEAMIDEINVVTIQDTWWSPIEPLETTNFFNNGITSFEVQFWSGSDWLAIPGGTVSGNTKVWRRFTFSAISTQKIRVKVNAAKSAHSILMELEAFGVLPETPFPTPSPSPPPDDDIAPLLAQRDIFIDPSNNVGFGTTNPIFNDDGTTGAFVGKWVAIDGKLPGAAAYLGIGGSVPKVNQRVGGLNFYNMAMGGVDNRTGSIFSFNGPTLGTGNLEFYTTPSILGPVRRMQIAPTGEVGINHNANAGTMLQIMGRTADATTHALGVSNGADKALLTVRNDGQVTVSQPGQGIVLKSPDGKICKKLAIDNSGALVVQNMPSCP